MALAHPGLEQDSFEALARTIERFQTKGIQVVLYAPAYYEKYSLYFTDNGSSMIDEKNRAVAKLQQNYGVDYFDFSTDPDLTTHPELFYISDHLSECGRKVMSSKLFKLLHRNSQLNNKFLFQP